MTFIDTNVFMYAVGRPHPLRAAARSFFEQAVAQGRELGTSAEVLQELLHAYLPVKRWATLDAAYELVRGTVSTILSIEPEDVLQARRLADSFPALGARELLHLACCQRHGVVSIKTFDRALEAATDQA